MERSKWYRPLLVGLLARTACSFSASEQSVLGGIKVSGNSVLPIATGEGSSRVAQASSGEAAQGPQPDLWYHTNMGPPLNAQHQEQPQYAWSGSFQEAASGAQPQAAHPKQPGVAAANAFGQRSSPGLGKRKKKVRPPVEAPVEAQVGAQDPRAAFVNYNAYLHSLAQQQQGQNPSAEPQHSSSAADPAINSGDRQTNDPFQHVMDPAYVRY